ncbi:MAG: hypothetical protein Q8P02_04290, partial [Candidatus Micrarchaeota archaeon]|nr:hypothetical protein [Candidatus Micrarchaeota archaeon]
VPSDNTFLWFAFLVFAAGLFLIAGPDQVITGLVTGSSLSFETTVINGNSGTAVGSSTPSADSAATDVQSSPKADALNVDAPQTNAADLSLYNFNKYPIQVDSAEGAEKDFGSFINDKTVVHGSNGVLIAAHLDRTGPLYSQILLKDKTVRVVTGCPPASDDGKADESCVKQKTVTTGLLHTLIDEAFAFTFLPKECKIAQGNTENKACIVCGDKPPAACLKVVVTGTSSPGTGSTAPGPDVAAGSSQEVELKKDGYAGVPACIPSRFKVTLKAGKFTPAKEDKISFTALLKKVDANQHYTSQSASLAPAVTLDKASVILTVGLFPLKADGSPSASGTPLYAKFCSKKESFGAFESSAGRSLEHCQDLPASLKTPVADGFYALSLEQLGVKPTLETADKKTVTDVAKASSVRFTGLSVKRNPASFLLDKGGKVQVKVWMRQWFTDDVGASVSGKKYCSTPIKISGGKPYSVGESMVYDVDTDKLAEVKVDPAKTPEAPPKTPAAPQAPADPTSAQLAASACQTTYTPGICLNLKTVEGQDGCNGDTKVLVSDLCPGGAEYRCCMTKSTYDTNQKALTAAGKLKLDKAAEYKKYPLAPAPDAIKKLTGTTRAVQRSECSTFTRETDCLFMAKTKVCAFDTTTDDCKAGSVASVNLCQIVIDGQTHSLYTGAKSGEKTSSCTFGPGDNECACTIS